MSIYTMFDVDESMEKDGIEVDYGDVRFRIARAGGSNKQFRKLFQDLTKPYKHQLQNDQMSEETSNQIMAKVYAKAVIQRVDAKEEDGKWAIGFLPLRDGELVPDSVEARETLLLDLKELFADLQTMAGTAANYRKFEDEEDEGN